MTDGGATSPAQPLLSGLPCGMVCPPLGRCVPLPQEWPKCAIGGTFLTIGIRVTTISPMSSTSGVVSAAFHVGVKGRVVLPAAVRRAAHLEEGAEVVARPDGEGRVVIETVASIRERIWNAAPPPIGADTAEDMRELRDADESLSAANQARAAAELGSEQDSAAAGAALLAHLGL